ncbi:MAG: hypothetical protein JO147_01385 [Actinobacteria bacterium]|nr:hypothetical protein [Actinomycetota bacterium]
MCTYATVNIAATGSAKTDERWRRIDGATVYFDHPVHALADHTLNIDFAVPSAGPAGRVALELTADTALALAAAIQDAIASAPPALVAESVARAS